MKKNYSNSETRIIVKNYDMPRKDDISVLLDKCILLNTYLSSYFARSGYIDDYDIRFRLDYYKEKEEMYLKDQELDLTEASSSYAYSLLRTVGTPYKNTLLINNLVVRNTEANEKVTLSSNNDWVQYNYIYSNLAKGLEKEVSR